MSKNDATTEPTAAQTAGARSWVPKEIGETISGTIVGFQVYTHDKYGKSPVIILDTGNDDAEGGRVRQVYVVGVLLGQFKAMEGAKKGDRYTVIYLGEEVSRGANAGREYHNYASYKGDAPELAESVNLEDFA